MWWLYNIHLKLSTNNIIQLDRTFLKVSEKNIVLRIIDHHNDKGNIMLWYIVFNMKAYR